MRIAPGIQPSPSRPARASAAGAWPPSHTSSGACTGSGSSTRSSTTEPDHHPRNRGSSWSIHAVRLPVGQPWAARSSGVSMPATRLSSSRPPLNRSSWASDLANWNGLRPGPTTCVPIFSFGTRAAANARPTSGSTVPLRNVSGSHTESKRHASIASMARPKPSSPSAPRPV